MLNYRKFGNNQNGVTEKRIAMSTVHEINKVDIGSGLLALRFFFSISFLLFE